MKKENIDFVLKEDFDSKIVFRFKPRESTCHSFNETPPKTWKDVYKVYYSYEIFLVYKDDDLTLKLFDEPCDECSAIDGVAEICKRLSEGKQTITQTHNDKTYTKFLLNNEIRSIGSGVKWIIRTGYHKDKYEINLYNYFDVGYRFWLSKEQIGKFGDFLNECCEYMLAHGDPI